MNQWFTSHVPLALVSVLTVPAPTAAQTTTPPPENPDFVGEIAGEVPRFPFQGVSGPSAALDGLSALSLLGPGLSGGVIDLSDAFGICLVNAGFWDDRSKAHINFVLALPSDSVFEPRSILVGWEGSEQGFEPGQLMINAMVLWSDPTYEETKDRVLNPPEHMEGGFEDMVMKGLAGEFDEEPLGPGRNWQLTANAGALELTAITPDAIEGTVQAYLRGTWTETEVSGQVAYVQIEGDFAWQVDETSRSNLLSCAGPD